VTENLENFWELNMALVGHTGFILKNKNKKCVGMVEVTVDSLFMGLTIKFTANHLIFDDGGC
jgi:hypothetical protein